LSTLLVTGNNIIILLSIIAHTASNLLAWGAQKKDSLGEISSTVIKKGIALKQLINSN
jgi:hypothetical protein